MKRFLPYLLVVMAGYAAMPAWAYEAPQFPFSPAAGDPGTVAVWSGDPLIKGWATGIEVEYGEEVAEEWKTPEAALGPAFLNDNDVVVLGRGGSAVLEFMPSIRDGDGYDFAVFENSFSGTFLELAYVEVSSDGVHFVRFPNYSLTADPVGGFGVLQAEYIEGFAGKHAGGFGTPFDLSELAAAHAALLQGYDRFSEAYGDTLRENFPHLNLEAIQYVRLIDIPGDGSRLDCEGFPVYDPYPTIITAGFDLDAVGVLNPVTIPVISFSDWSGGFSLEPRENADTDGDGWSQYMEYLFASDPSDAGSRPSISQTIDPAGGYSLLYWRNLAAESTLELIYSLDGSTWQAAESILSLETLISGGRVLALEQFLLPMTDESILVRFVAVPN
ncbi:MAG: hypothetical protein AB3N33_13175 [Puniceicoccaceae bacterium]